MAHLPKWAPLFTKIDLHFLLKLCAFQMSLNPFTKKPHDKIQTALTVKLIAPVIFPYSLRQSPIAHVQINNKNLQFFRWHLVIRD